jgi:hypothetical protein
MLAKKLTILAESYSGILCLFSNKYFSTKYAMDMPMKHMGIDMGTRGAKNTETKNRLEVFDRFDAMSK